MTAGFKLWRRAALEAIGLENIRSNGYSFQVEMAYLCEKLGFRLIEFALRPLDQRDDVALPEDTARDPARVEHVEPVELFAHADEADRQARDSAHRQRSAAPAMPSARAA